MNTRRERRNRQASSSRPKKNDTGIHWIVEYLWALIGLLLTIFSTFFEASITNMPWDWSDGLSTHPLGVTYQVGAVLITGCLGGRDAGIIAQVAYVILGLTSLSVFAQGGGPEYWREPTFGYILGFMPGAGLCGALAFKRRNSLENLAYSAFCGLGIIHLLGTIYIIVLSLTLSHPALKEVPQLLLHYSILPLPGQAVIICVIAFLGYLVRRILFY